MNKGQFLVGPTVRAAVVATLATTGWMACSNPADNVPAAAVADPVAAPEAQAMGPSLTYTLAEATTISFTGSKVTGIHEGGFKGFEGTITMVEGDPLRSSMQLTIDTPSMWTDSDKLTGHLKSSDFFDVENHPTATFTSTVTVRGDSAPSPISTSKAFISCSSATTSLASADACCSFSCQPPTSGSNARIPSAVLQMASLSSTRAIFAASVPMAASTSASSRSAVLTAFFS